MADPPFQTSVGVDARMAELNGLLASDPNPILDMEQHLYDRMVGRINRPIVLFGAGGLGRKTLAGFAGTGLEPLCFADNNAAIHGTVVDGLPVLSPTDAVATYRDTAVFLVSVFIGYEDVVAQLKRMGAAVVVPFFVLFWRFPDRYLPHYSYDLPHKVIDAAEDVRAAAQLLGDAPSRTEYAAQVGWRLDPLSGALPSHTNGDIYFPDDLVALHDHEVFIDCGAYDGDTLVSFLDRVGRRFNLAYVFEPDPRNLIKLQRTVDSLPSPTRDRIRVEALAVGRSSGAVGLQLSNAASSVGAAGDVMVRSEPLDQVLGGAVPTYLKMDIEGAEIDALEGARGVISGHRPVLAISAYHLQDHLWAIPQLIASFVDGYRYFYRRYTRHPNDDLVLYAIPGERSLA